MIRLIDFVWINILEGVGVLLLDVYVKIEIIDFLLPRIKQKMRKCHNYTRLCSTFIAFSREESFDNVVA